MRNTLVVNLYGGPGSGKSTTAAGIFSILKLHGVTCEMALEYAKDMVWEGRHETIKNQVYVFGKQFNRIYRLLGKVDVIITDSPLLLSIVYKPDEPYYNSTFNNFVTYVVDSTDNLHVVLKRVKKYSAVGRLQTEPEAILIDSKVKELIEENSCMYLEIQGNYEGINELSEIILDRLGIDGHRFRLVQE
jgi:hypothetical protein